MFLGVLATLREQSNNLTDNLVAHPERSFCLRSMMDKVIMEFYANS